MEALAAQEALKQQPDNTILFNGQIVEPGEIVGTNEAIKGRRFLILQKTVFSYVVVPKTVALQWQKADLIALRLDKKGIHYNVERELKVLKTFHIIDAAKHAIPGLVKYDEQIKLIDGTDVGANSKEGSPAGSGGGGINAGYSHWRKMANGVRAYVKGTNKTGTFTDVHKEALAFNIARSCGLGEYLPVVSIFKHPGQPKRAFAVIEEIKYGRHCDGLQPAEFVKAGVPAPEKDRDLLRRLGDEGVLDKLALFDQIIGNQDRHQFNYLLTPKDPPYIKLIDHGIALDFSDGGNNEREYSMPSYASSYHYEEDRKLHPAARQWVLGLNLDTLRKDMESPSVPERVIDTVIARAQKIQEVVKEGGDNITFRAAFYPWSGRRYR